MTTTSNAAFSAVAGLDASELRVAVLAALVKDESITPESIMAAHHGTTETDNERCEDYPCCGHTDGLGCNWVAPDYASMPHGLCDHENGICEEVDDEYGDEY